MIDRIINTYKLASGYERELGASWYYDVHQFAAALARRFNAPIESVVGMLAVLSPRQSWRVVCQTVTRMLAAHAAGYDVGYMRWPGLAYNVEKAVGILITGDVERYLSGDKVRSFYDNIMNYESSYAVTVDVWTLRVVNGLDVKAKNIPSPLYREIEIAYQIAAEQLDLQPLDLQAITWLTVQRLTRNPAGQLPLF